MPKIVFGEEGYTMDLKKLRQICDNGCCATNIFSTIPKTIAQHTVRTKGQFFTQRLFYIREGETEFVLNDGKVISCKKGDIVYLPPDITYESHWKEASESDAILIRFDLMSEGVPTILFDEIFVIAHDSYGEYLSLFLQLHTAFERGLVGYKLKCQSIFLDLLHLLAHHLQKQESIQKNGVIYRAIFFIENHCFEELDLDSIAQMCSLCPSAFRRHFRAATGMSPIRYKNRLMMKKAAELLQTGDLSVSEVARAIGIEDIYYFNRMFKQFYGMPPGKFRAGEPDKKEE